MSSITLSTPNFCLITMMSTFRQQKQVRFATHKNTFHSPHTPLLTFASDDSESSSSGPITPPQMFDSLPEPFPYTVSHVPQYFKYANPLHYVEPLRPNQLLESAAVNWDLMLNPSTITLNNCYSLSSRMLVEQATIPAQPALSIILSIHFPWSIDVHASNGSYVTLEDLFDSVYHSLRTNVTANEYNLLVLPHKDDKKRAARAYKQRYERIRNISAQDEEKRGGMKRIDFLKGRTRFRSISNTGRRSDEWRLDVT